MTLVPVITYTDLTRMYFEHHQMLDIHTYIIMARQPLVGPGLLKKLCPFLSVEGDFFPILDL
jgi:hypothetical protein